MGSTCQLFLVLRGEKAEGDGSAAPRLGGHIQHPVHQHLLLAAALPICLLTTTSKQSLIQGTVAQNCEFFK